ncbi:MAG: hypothetical protein JF599_09120 [Verrucomicrobia bacterium]|nr:hypothetical protein [Verrucomicrobiota bacterium]
MNLYDIPYIAQIIQAFTVISVVAMFVLTIFLAAAVQSDAVRRLNSKGGTFLIGHWGWFFVVLMSGGFLGALAYWLIHYSSLRYAPKD